MAQCRFFGRPMTVWDSEAFHFIDAAGVHSALKKELFLNWPEKRYQKSASYYGMILFTTFYRLRFCIENVRYLTIASGGTTDPKTLISTVQYLLSIAEGKRKVLSSTPLQDGGLPLNVQRLVISFLLQSIPPTIASSSTATSTTVLRQLQQQEKYHPRQQKRRPTKSSGGATTPSTSSSFSALKSDVVRFMADNKLCSRNNTSAGDSLEVKRSDGMQRKKRRY